MGSCWVVVSEAGHDEGADDGRDECRNKRLVADPADGLDLEGEHGAGERNSEHRAEPAGDRGDEQQPTVGGIETHRTGEPIRHRAGHLDRRAFPPDRSAE